MKNKLLIGLIGLGNMGSAIAEQLKLEYQIFVFDKDKSKTKDISEIKIATNNVYLIKAVDIAILAVKPQDFTDILKEIKDYCGGKLIISIAAGITTVHIENNLPGARVIRVMPNLPARIGQGLICLCKGKSAKVEDLNFAEQLFDNLGRVVILKEEMMNAATAISGSGPGYLFDLIIGKNIEESEKYTKQIFIPNLKKAAESIGFTEDLAQLLAEATANGSMAFLKMTGITPTKLKKQVASKGGTTDAGLEILHKGGTLKEAVKAALRRAEELCK